MTGTASIKLNSVAQQGYIRINSLDIKSDTPGVTNPEAWTGTYFKGVPITIKACLLYTSDAADDLLCVDLGGRRIIKKKTTKKIKKIVKPRKQASKPYSPH